MRDLHYLKQFCLLLLSELILSLDFQASNYLLESHLQLYKRMITHIHRERERGRERERKRERGERERERTGKRKLTFALLIL